MIWVICSVVSTGVADQKLICPSLLIFCRMMLHASEVLHQAPPEVFHLPDPEMCHRAAKWIHFVLVIRAEQLVFVGQRYRPDRKAESRRRQTLSQRNIALKHQHNRLYIGTAHRRKVL